MLPQFCLISLDSTHAFLLRTFEGWGRKKMIGHQWYVVGHHPAESHKGHPRGHFIIYTILCHLGTHGGIRGDLPLLVPPVPPHFCLVGRH